MRYALFCFLWSAAQEGASEDLVKILDQQRLLPLLAPDPLVPHQVKVDLPMSVPASLTDTLSRRSPLL